MPYSYQAVRASLKDSGISCLGRVVFKASNVMHRSTGSVERQQFLQMTFAELVLNNITPISCSNYSSVSLNSLNSMETITFRNNSIMLLATLLRLLKGH